MTRSQHEQRLWRRAAARNHLLARSLFTVVIWALHYQLVCCHILCFTFPSTRNNSLCRNYTLPTILRSTLNYDVVSDHTPVDNRPCSWTRWTIRHTIHTIQVLRFWIVTFWVALISSQRSVQLCLIGMLHCSMHGIVCNYVLHKYLFYHPSVFFKFSFMTASKFSL